jgi:ubiquinone/menaquinone biosynthesis C-methylase UbiE
LNNVKDVFPYIKNLFETQEKWLFDSAKAINIVKPIKREVKEIIDYSNLQSIEKYHQKLFELLFHHYNSNKLDETMNLLINRLKLNDLNEIFFEGKDCLDIGCGGGRFTFVLSKLGAKSVTGTDIGDKSLKYAIEMARNLNLHNISFVNSNSYDIELKSNQFDFIVSNGVLHHHTKLEDALFNISRLLKPGGTFWLYMEGELTGVINMVREQVKKVMKYIPIEFTKEIFEKAQIPSNSFNYILDGMYAVYYYHSEEEIKAILEKSGFTKFKKLKDNVDISDNSSVYGNSQIRLLCKK